ncbi:hypothetical protein P0D69_28160 [Paraburkholderia sediminicola]|uniref:hypothetical protein n=1 Tax=Paraburkholderia sediminicola TaxID=458836 RepID=UPI0038BD3903
MAKIGPIILPTTTSTISGQSVTFADSTQLQLILNKIATQLDALTAGQVAAVWNAASAPPTAVGKPIMSNPTGRVLGITYGVGDFIRNSNPTVFQSNGHSYITLGWMCTQAGNVGTANPPVFQACNVEVNP